MKAIPGFNICIEGFGLKVSSSAGDEVPAGAVLELTSQIIT